MKVLVIGPDYFNYTGSVTWALEEQGHQVVQQLCGDFWGEASYLTRKLHKWGLKGAEHDYYREWNRRLITAYQAFSPDVCLVLNGDRLFTETLEVFLSGGSRLLLWLLDSICRMPGNETNLRYYHGIFSFEYRDQEYLQKKYGLTCGYCPVGYDSRVYFPDDIRRDQDIAFVGVPVARRLGILRLVADYAARTGRSLAVYGQCWDDRYFWKKMRFVRRNGVLHHYVHNHFLLPAAVASVYRRTKVCLNIHIPEHEGVNPRTFEILATGSFQLVDQKPLLGQLLRLNQDLSVYHHEEELLEKLDYFLNHDAEREVVARQGLAAVSEKYSMQECVKQLFNGGQFP
ncbi:MAG TPA: glycosyltransferase [Patescibacteria group bacterium]|nr:glycosyltransferase [Patescibacteria group bacterium]